MTTCTSCDELQVSYSIAFWVSGFFLHKKLEGGGGGGGDQDGTVVTLSLSPLRSEFDSPARPHVGKLVVVCCWLEVYGTER